MNCNEGALSIILSTCSLLAAIGIPALIAYRQNKIALYDKRLTAYKEFLQLKSFYNCCKECNSIGEDDEKNTVNRYCSAYLSIHYSPLDKEYQRNGSVLQSAYALEGLEKDKNILTLLVYLNLLDDKEITQDIYSALESFIKVLFGITNSNTKNMDLLKRNFESKFSIVLKNEKKIEKKLKF